MTVSKGPVEEGMRSSRWPPVKKLWASGWGEVRLERETRIVVSRAG